MTRWLIPALLVLAACDREATERGAITPDDLARHNAAVADMGAFDYASAMAALEALAARYPGNADIATDLSIAQLNRQQAGDEAAALARLDAVLNDAPDHLRARYTAGILRFNAGDIETARSHFRAVYDADVEDAHAAYYLAQSLVQLDQLEQAVGHFAESIERDPYLRSAYYAGSQTARRFGDMQRAHDWLETFTRLEHNPRGHLAEIKYTRMGPKAEIVVLDGPATDVAGPPDGPILAVDQAQHTACDACPTWETISVAALSDTRWVVATSAHDTLSLNVFDDQRWFEPLPGAFASVTGVKATMWGDVDADGYVDLIICRDGPNQLWRGGQGESFQRDDRFDGGGDVTSVDGALFDADHDGDLDVFFVNRGGPSTLVNNNGDGTWRQVTDESSGFPDAGGDGREVVVADFDGDLDIDIIQINDTPPHAVWINDRLWNWHVGDAAWAALIEADLPAAVAGDIDADGEMELVSMSADWSLTTWDQEDGVWARASLADAMSATDVDADATLVRPANRPRRVALADLTGDGRLDVLASTGWQRRWTGYQPPIMRLVSHDGRDLDTFDGHQVWTLWNRDVGQGPGYLGAGAQGVITYIPPGPGRFEFVDLTLTGRHDTGQSMRSNASGLGTRVGARVGTRWTVLGALRDTAGPGQNLQPLAVGLGGAAAIDFVAIDWSDGVYQTESGLTPGAVHRIVETQRQLSSCPLIFARTDQGMDFMTDCLGVGGMGFLLEPGVHATPRSHERVLLDASFRPPAGSGPTFVLAEPMQETCYLDAVAVDVVDLPDGWEVLPDERMGTGEPLPTSDLLYARRFEHPNAARDGQGRNVLDPLRDVDGVAVDPGHVDGRFFGRVDRPFQLELDFDEPLDEIGHPVLVIDGWVEYPYSQTMFAAWQAGLAYQPPTIEARDGDGRWHLVHERVGYPAGMPRTTVLPLVELPSGTRSLRLTTTLELYVDRLRVASIETPGAVAVTRLVPTTASLDHVGFPRRLTGPQKRPDYRWDVRAPFWDVRVQAGRYTRLGSVRGLIDEADGSLAVFGAGDAVQITFESPDPPPPGTRRRFVLDVVGWCKDMDLMTRDGGRVEPVPGTGPDETQEALRTRYRSGR